MACKPEGEEVVQHYVTGEISRTHTEVKGKKQGKMTDYYRDGKIKGERLFENDQQVGRSVFYYPSGKIKEVQYFDQGKMHGGDTVYYELGNPQFLRTFEHGKLHGYIRKWAMDGTVTYEARYAHDTLVEVKGEPVHPDTLMNKY